MILNKLFVPSNCLQGEEIPVHMLWPKDRNISIEIKKPKNFEVLRIHNAEKLDLNERNRIQISRFEENGYLGIIFKTPQLPEHTKDEEFLFKITDSEGKKQDEKKTVHLFRPSIKVVNVPDQINVKKQRNRNVCTVKDKISISNEGEGIAVINFKVCDDSELTIEEPEGTGQFAKSFWEDWSASLEKTKSEFPDYSSLIDKFISIGKSPPKFDEEGIQKMKEVFEELYDTIQTDSTFEEEFAKTLVVAFMKNLHFMTEIESFVTYLKSIEKNRIIINNPIEVINVGRESKQLKAEITIVDLGLNSFPPIPVEVEFIAEEICEVPIHKVLKVV